MLGGIDPKVIAVSNFVRLAKAADDRVEKDCFGKYICIALSETSRVYIGFSFVLSESAIVCEVNDTHPRLNKSDVVPYVVVIEYIQNMHEIINVHTGVYAEGSNNINHVKLS
jgi:hypothetical protein